MVLQKIEDHVFDDDGETLWVEMVHLVSNTRGATVAVSYELR